MELKLNLIKEMSKYKQANQKMDYLSLLFDELKKMVKEGM